MSQIATASQPNRSLITWIRAHPVLALVLLPKCRNYLKCQGFRSKLDPIDIGSFKRF
jgi:hypothetical protein